MDPYDKMNPALNPADLQSKYYSMDLASKFGVAPDIKPPSPGDLGKYG